jgi:hypothetical protein
MWKLNLGTITIPFVYSIKVLLHEGFEQPLNFMLCRSLLPIVWHISPSPGMVISNALVVGNQLIPLCLASRAVTEAGQESTVHHLLQYAIPLHGIWIHEVPTINSVQVFKEGLAFGSDQSQNLLYSPIWSTTLVSAFGLT